MANFRRLLTTGAAVLASAASDLDFRPPAIPLFTTDPFMQTWMRGDNSTSAPVSHWTGAEKQMTASLAIDGKVYQILGACAPPAVTKPGPATELAAGVNISPGANDIAHFKDNGADDCNIRCYTAPTCQAFVLSNGNCYLKSAAAPTKPVAGSCQSYVITGSHPSCADTGSPLRQISATAAPTRTVFELELPGVLSATLTFLQTMFTDEADWLRLSRPVFYARVDVKALDVAPHDVKLYFDASAQHAVNEQSQQVEWKAWGDGGAQSAGFRGVQVGNAVQNVVGSKGDRVNIDWGYLHLAAPADDAATTLFAGSAAAARASFAAHHALPAAGSDTRMPRAVSDDLPALATVHDFGAAVGAAGASHTVMLAYDDVESVFYFGTDFKALWTQTYPDIAHAIAAAHAEGDAMLAKSEAHDAALMGQLDAKAGDKYAALCALAYRQTLAATKLVWNHERNVTWNFLKEISTNGDMSTMDVIYPGSPMLLHANPALLKLLLLPVLSYAHNDTYIQFSDPYSPHQLGTYPIANDTTARQEPMPLENSGNMIFMLLAIVQQDPAHDASFIAPYFEMLASWADEIARTTEFPANQICTDDFTGKLANNTNLGAKGIVSLQAFSALCALPGVGNDGGKVDCAKYAKTAADFAQTWMRYARVEEPLPHYKLSYNTVAGVPDSWSIKYNLLWQKLLKLDGPFPWDTVVGDEIKYYISKSNAFGIPMDPRHTYVKTDWLSWAAAMTSTDADFHTIMDPIFKFANETPSRNPFTDLYDTVTSVQSTGGFIARPVIGGLFAKMLL